LPGAAWIRRSQNTHSPRLGSTMRGVPLALQRPAAAPRGSLDPQHRGCLLPRAPHRCTRLPHLCPARQRHAPCKFRAREPAPTEGAIHELGHDPPSSS
jgi:hypothetical protein